MVSDNTLFLLLARKFYCGILLRELTNIMVFVLVDCSINTVHKAIIFKLIFHLTNSKEIHTRTSTSTINYSYLMRAGADVLSRVQIMYSLFYSHAFEVWRRVGLRFSDIPIRAHTFLPIRTRQFPSAYVAPPAPISPQGCLNDSFGGLSVLRHIVRPICLFTLSQPIFRVLMDTIPFCMLH